MQARAESAREQVAVEISAQSSERYSLGGTLAIITDGAKNALKHTY
jgi:hypothetical protein